MSPTNEEFLAELESRGVGEVKERIATNVYMGGLRDIAKGWVERKEAASNAEQLALAHQAYATAQSSNNSCYRGNFHDCEHCGAIQTLIGALAGALTAF